VLGVDTNASVRAARWETMGCSSDRRGRGVSVARTPTGARSLKRRRWSARRLTWRPAGCG